MFGAKILGGDAERLRYGSLVGSKSLLTDSTDGGSISYDDSEDWELSVWGELDRLVENL